MVVLGDGIEQALARLPFGGLRRDEAGLGAVGLEKEGPLFYVPAVVAAGFHDVHLFDIVLAHVAQIECAGLLIEAKGKGVAKAQSIDFADARAHEGVVLRDGVASVGRGDVAIIQVHIDAE